MCTDKLNDEVQENINEIKNKHTCKTESNVENVDVNTRENLAVDPDEVTNEANNKFEISNLHISILAILLFISVSLCGFHFYAMNVTDPSYIANKYANAKSLHDYNALKKYFDSNIFDNSYDGVYDQEILDITIREMNLYTEFSGVDYIDYSYSYYVDESTELRGGDVSLSLLSDKKWFFYDNWVIDPEYAMIADVGVKMLKPVNATLGSEDLESIATKFTTNEDGTVTYTLPTMLRGKYTLNINYPFAENVQYTLDVDYESINKIEPELNSDQSLLLTEKAEEILHHIYNKDFTTLVFDSLDEELDLARANYFNKDQFEIKFSNAFTSIDLNEYNISNIETDLSILMYDDSDCYSTFVSINGEVSASGVVVDSTSDDSYDDSFIGEIKDFTVYFEFDGTDWVVADIKLVYPL